MFLVGFGDDHTPEAVLDVEFAEEDGAVVVREGGDHEDESAKHIAQLLHGVCGGVGLVGEFIDGLGV